MDPAVGTKAGKAAPWMLLAGAILQAAWALFVVWYSTGWHLTLTFWVLSGVGSAGVLAALLAYGQARARRPNMAFGLGLVAAALPPVQIVTLIGAILCKAIVPRTDTGAPDAEPH